MTLAGYYTSTFIDNHHSSLPLYTHIHSTTPCISDITQPLIILIHGAGGDHRQFDTVFPALIQKGHPVMVPDLRHHGRSQPKGDSESNLDFNIIMADLDRALLWFRQHQSQSDKLTVILGGLSMGGMIVQLYAQHLMLPKITSFPGLIKVYALIGIGCGHISITSPTIPWVPFYKTATYADAHEMIPAARQSIIDSAHSAFGKLVAQSEACLVDDKVLFHCFRACSRILSIADHDRLLSSIPQLLLRGEYDTHTQDVMEAWYSELKVIESNTTVYNIIPKTGHLATIDDGNLVSQSIIAFLSSLK